MFKKLIKYFLIQKFSILSKKFLSSAGYKLEAWPSSISKVEFNTTWSSKMIKRQHKTWGNLIKDSNYGNRKDISALTKSLKKINLNDCSIIEIGCGSAYNKNLLSEINKTTNYFGLDSSASALEYARNLDFDHRLVQSTSDSIPLKDKSVDLVLDGAALIHILDWKSSVKEYARVSKKFIILHSITLTNDETTLFSKYAYGAKVYEIAFNREELTNTLINLNYKITSVETGEIYDLNPYLGIQTKSETWLLERTY